MTILAAICRAIGAICLSVFAAGSVCLSWEAQREKRRAPTRRIGSSEKCKLCLQSVDSSWGFDTDSGPYHQECAIAAREARAIFRAIAEREQQKGRRA